MAKKEKLDAPELKELKSRERAKRKKAKVTETIAKEAADIQLKARKHTEAILDKMIEIATSEDAKVTDSARIQAGHFVFDRAYGKAAQTNINANVNNDGKPSEIAGSALTRRIEAALKRVEELTNGGSKPPVGEERPKDVRLSDSDPDGSTRH